jgi:S-(hydroxymethyl)glutathione dehydrogenase/alcohol dehydrogenase
VSALTTEAAVLARFGEPLVLRELELAEPASDEVLVRTAACGICHSDRSAQQGHSPRARRAPVVLGHEAAGVVEATGTSVRHVESGDAVVACAAASCGDCRWCRLGFEQHCDAPRRSRAVGQIARLSLDREPVEAFVGVGGFATRMLVHERALVRVPREMPLEKAALLGCAVQTAFGAVRHRAAVAPGETVAVIGCGGVGLSIVQAARLAGASRIVAVDVTVQRADRARAFGATGVVASDDAVEAVHDVTDGGVDHAFEAVGSSRTIALACAVTRKRGTVTVVGLPPPDEAVEIPAGELFAEKRIEGSKMGQGYGTDIPWYCRLYLEGQLELDRLVTRTVLLSGINEALDELASGDGARTVVAFPADS